MVLIDLEVIEYLMMNYIIDDDDDYLDNCVKNYHEDLIENFHMDHYYQLKYHLILDLDFELLMQQLLQFLQNSVFIIKEN